MVALRGDGEIEKTLDLLQQAAVDITGAHMVEVVVREDRKVLWINVNGVCVFRVCRINEIEVGGAACLRT